MRISMAIAICTTMLCGLSAAAADAGDPERGAALWKKCKTCHQIGEGAENRVGPVLTDVIGRAAGAVEGFHYSKAMQAAGAGGLVWDVETLDKFLAEPKAVVDQTRMSFRGLRDAGDRADLIAFLQTNSAGDPPAAGTEDPAAEIVVDPAVLALQGDRDYGEYLSSECLTCHQATGKDDGIPSITGWPAENFVIALHAYKQKVRAHPVMQMMAGRLSDEEIAALAAYFQTLE